jgi:7-cyano-7-deazaguanine synthase
VESQMMKVVLIFSGGLDSTTLLYDLLSQGHKVYCLSVNYGQRHGVELLAAQKICAARWVVHQIADLRGLQPLLKGSSQTDPLVEVPEGHYAEESMKLTIVPNRNMLMLAVAGAWAIGLKADVVAYAAHAGDHAIYPDCRDEFARALGEALALADWHSVQLLRPYVHLSKADIVKRGNELGVPFEETWSCYKGGTIHCGRCGTCVERREAFQLAGLIDPTAYESVGALVAD